MSLQASFVLASTINQPSSGNSDRIRIVPGDPENSYLVWKIEGRDGIAGERMPLDQPPLLQARIDLIKSWIEAMVE